MNGRLIDYYLLEFIPFDVKPVEIDEIEYSFLPDMINDLRNDFIMADSVSGEPLEILEFDEVIETIEKTITNCLAI